MTGPRAAEIPTGEIAAVIFDMDGVITDTASVHSAAWKRMFDAYLAEREGDDARPFSDDDYQLYVDGKPRYDGVDDFLRSRGIELPRGEPADSPDTKTVCGLGNRKQEMFARTLREQGVAVFPTSVELLRRLRGAGLGTAVISASKNAAQVLESAGVIDLFDARVDGEVADELGLAGKPDPAVFLEAAGRVGVTPAEAAIVEDAIAGVEAGRRGEFALVIGVDRVGNADRLRSHGADVVVEDLGELRVTGRPEQSR
jgi:alpha,alpha-trehalase